MIVREMRASDVAAIAELEKRCFSAAEIGEKIEETADMTVIDAANIEETIHMEGFFAREETVIVYYRTNLKPSRDFATLILNESSAHTGNPLEGDSIGDAWHACSHSQNIKQDGDNYLYQAKYKFTYTTTAEQEAARRWRRPAG